MPLVSNYTILVASRADELARLVQEQIEEGWQPFGSPLTSVTKAGTSVYAQSIVKYAGVAKQAAPAAGKPAPSKPAPRPVKIPPKSTGPDPLGANAPDE